MTVFHAMLAVSLDGFIARADGSVDWLAPHPPPEAFFAEFLAGVDLILMGRGTFGAVMRQGGWPYQGKRAVVVASRALSGVPEGVEVRGGPLEAIVAGIEASGAARVWVEGGGVLLSGLLGLGRLDVLELGIVPVVLGGGIPLLPAPGPAAGFRLARSGRMGEIAHLVWERA